ncbi:MAG: sulfur carrier protein ThiS [Pseudomonadota bacterium]
MQIMLNGVLCDTQAETLTALLVQEGFSGRVATAVNEEFVPAALRDEQSLKDGDRVEVLAPMQGG